MKLNVKRGTRYAAGATLPWYVSKAMLSSWAQSHGFVDVVVRDRKGTAFSYDPTRAAKYSDKWDTAIEATYTGNATTVDFPAAPAWVIELGTRDGSPSSIPKRARSPAPATATAPGFSRGAVVLVMLLWIAADRSSRR